MGTSVGAGEVQRGRGRCKGAEAAAKGQVGGWLAGSTGYAEQLVSVAFILGCAANKCWGVVQCEGCAGIMFST